MPLLICGSLFIIALLTAFFAIGKSTANRENHIERMQRNRDVLERMAIARDTPPAAYANKKEALLAALALLELNQTYTAAGIVEQWCTPEEFNMNDFQELADPVYMGYAEGYVYNVIRRLTN